MLFSKIKLSPFCPAFHNNFIFSCMFFFSYMFLRVYLSVYNMLRFYQYYCLSAFVIVFLSVFNSLSLSLSIYNYMYLHMYAPVSLFIWVPGIYLSINHSLYLSILFSSLSVGGSVGLVPPVAWEIHSSDSFPAVLLCPWLSVPHLYLSHLSVLYLSLSPLS